MGSATSAPCCSCDVAKEQMVKGNPPTEQPRPGDLDPASKGGPPEDASPDQTSPSMTRAAVASADEAAGNNGFQARKGITKESDNPERACNAKAFAWRGRQDSVYEVEHEGKSSTGAKSEITIDPAAGDKDAKPRNSVRKPTTFISTPLPPELLQQEGDSD